MSEIIKNRTIRPSTRKAKSKSYKIDTKKVSKGDVLIVNINHESNPFKKTFKFDGADVEDKNSISFRVNEAGNSVEITWSGAKPIGQSSIKLSSKKNNKTENKNAVKKGTKTENNKTNHKTSFEPISNSDTKILILGTMPGDKSLELGEYYGHSRNKFWKIISNITNSELPRNYADKMKLLLKSKIGVWDVAHSANREGSLDTAIQNEVPNDIENFIKTHKNLKVIGFNGTKAKKLFDKYFSQKEGIK